MNPVTSMITLNVNGQSTQIKRQIARVDKKQDPTTYCVQQTHLKHQTISE